jgi:hypothetical protein
MRQLIAAVVFLAVGLVGSMAWAQDGGVIEIEESVIKGRIQKPEAFYILQHANPDYERLNSKPSFIEGIIESVQEEPF